MDDVFDVHAIIEDLPRALTSALIQLALPGRPLDDHWSTFYEAHKRLDALMDDEVWRLPRPSVHQRAGYLATHLTQVNAQVKAVPPTWGPDAPFNFDAVDQPAAVRLYKPHGTEQLVIDDARPAAYDPKGALGHRVDAASALTDPTHRLMLVVGEPGYGKSWLLAAPLRGTRRPRAKCLARPTTSSSMQPRSTVQ